MLEQQSDVEVVGEAGDGRTAVDLISACRPDVVVMDIGLPDLNGVEATRQILSQAPNVKVVALSVHADKRFVAGMFQAGACAYLLKTSAGRELMEAIQDVQAGQKYVSPKVAGAVIDDYVQRLDAQDADEDPILTPREREVLQLIVEGKTTPQIASQLNVSEKTIGTHRQHIMQKLDMHSVAELTKYAIREGLTSLES